MSIFISHGSEPQKDRLQAFAEDNEVILWTVNRHAMPGDTVVFYIKAPIGAFVATGIVKQAPTLDHGQSKWEGEYMAEVGVDCVVDPPLHRKDAVKLLPEWGWLRMPQAQAHVPVEFEERLIQALGTQSVSLGRIDHPTNVKKPRSTEPYLSEGGTKEVTQEIAYRNPRLKESAIKANGGPTCKVCGFNFADVYGTHGDGYIEIHHLRPLSQSKGKKHRVRLKDVILVCANCHRVLHRNGASPMDWRELRRMIQKRCNE